MTGGSVRSSIPIETRRFSPPEMPFSSVFPTSVFAQFYNSNSSIIASTRSLLISLVPFRRNFAENSRISFY